MAEPAPNPELMRSLGRLVRGLSALFWGLPTALLISFYSARTEGLGLFGILPAMATTGLILYGLWLMGDFQKQERVWRHALDRSRLLGLIQFGLSPFLYWWYRVPGNGLFVVMVLLLGATALLFLASLNLLLQRLGAMLPDETLRLEVSQFTHLNLNLLLATGILTAVYVVLAQFEVLPLYLQAVLMVLERGSYWFIVLLTLLPLAMTMALLWKTKEVILDNIFGSKQ
ncbi:MAG TPA: hypothetical protein VN673_00490 [Clostridia bacterium]|nr:hypothetical protein [Clostridia bacterium]